MAEVAVKIRGLCKTFRIGWKFNRFTALNNLNLDLQEGEILGFLGPNGAGKTTTFKLILGLIYPDKGLISLWGKSPKDPESRAYIGFLPENPYFYSYLTAAESLDLYARLFDIPYGKRQKRIAELLSVVGLEHAGTRQLRKFSRGMLQRVGIAQALINDPRLLILDEPMSGLDPMGRKEMRDIILKCRDQGKTVIFSSHIISDAEMICDRVSIILNGELQEIVHVNEMLDREITEWEIICSNLSKELSEFALNKGFEMIKRDDRVLIKIKEESQARYFMAEIEKQSGQLISFGPKRDSLEDIFVRKATKKE